ncbi:hypothetical protein V2I52_06870 [Brenneria sp. g21c3]|uniref:hypothetical protein n=1 Tax=Brenneria sp. g21c3 TaxID=3093893 RepID=UPI002EC045AD|nr:hypothetical protein [Brenneria sp. g21c3]
MKKYFYTFVSLFLSACSTNLSFMPEGGRLEDAQVGKIYSSRVTIDGGHVINLPDIIPLEPGDSGLLATPCKLSNEKTNKNTRLFVDYNCVDVKGIPVMAGEIKINLTGGVIGGMYTKATPFKKVFIIKIKP